MSKKVEVCFVCGHKMNGEGNPEGYVDTVTLLGLLERKVLQMTVCYECFRKRYKELKLSLEQRVRALKRNVALEDL